MTRVTTERRTRGATRWLSERVKSSQRYRPPKGTNLLPELRKGRKGPASRFYQLLSGHAAAGAYLADRMHKIPPSVCWWRGGGERQSRYHPLVGCETWRSRIRKLWREVGKAYRWKHRRAPPIRTLFRGGKATAAVLHFLRGTQFVLTAALGGGGRRVEHLAEEEGWREGGEDGLGISSVSGCLSFVFPLPVGQV